jgi:hypothetical protein
MAFSLTLFSQKRHRPDIAKQGTPLGRVILYGLMKYIGAPGMHWERDKGGHTLPMVGGGCDSDHFSWQE